ncbi:MAG: phosphohistidine phosphatase SixA [Desulfobacteraceae bacterium]
MLVYLVQHAEAKSKEEDPARDLTDQGAQDIKKVADQLGKFHPAINQILHSGKTRALSTANILAAALKPPQGVTPTSGLAPLDDPGDWASRLAEMDEHIMLVGHLPHLAKLATLLLTGDQEKSVINFKMGGVVCLRRSEVGQWAVDWMIIPEIIS